jgi:hypothetical protein
MTVHAERWANEAVFVLQLNTRDAVRYVQRNARVDEQEARTAVKQVVVFHKH